MSEPREMTEATLAQNRASDPLASTWLSANAGSGKTKVLTDRVARLLLRGVEPQRILCLTYTKAAASEMQNRLFALLGEWAMLPEARLRAELAQIDETPGRSLAEARRLFARAIETPGGLKIQTIHSFCATLLRRFPIEAGLSPAFTEMDERAGRALREDVLDAMAEGTDRSALDALAAVFTGADLDELLREICSNAEEFRGEEPGAALRAAFGLPDWMGASELLAMVFHDGEADLVADVLPYLELGSTTDMQAGERLSRIDLRAPGLEVLPELERVFLYKTGARAGAARLDRFPTKTTRRKLGRLLDPLQAFMERVEAARPLRVALAAHIRAQALHRFARAFLSRLDAAKAALGWLDFDDLIARAGRLLTDPAVAQWVLYKLDGGVDHILIDEAQDTSPSQWRVIENLAQEFTAGLGAVDASRTLFVVGDKKQSIYSFQGADLAVFDSMQAQFRERLSHVGLLLNEADLTHSFRSSDAVLRTVDMSFRPPNDAGLGGPPSHIAFFDQIPGRVDLWPLIARPESPEPPAWFEPVDVLPEEHHHRQLARTIAVEVRRMIDAQVPIRHRDRVRAMTEGDVLILVRRRNTLFHEIIAACKSEGLEIAGADRLRLGGEMAVRDLTALLVFLATPEDDLSLAASLRSPLFGWSEDALFRLAHGREGFLWARLRAEGYGATLDILNDLRRQTDFLRPYDLIERMLTRHDGRRRLVARLGPEAEDGIDALLAQALSYEQLETPSLTGFLIWLEHGDVQIKRELGAAEGRLRVMTVHGAKGLEAPVVILPDTADYAPRERRQLYPLGEAVAWRGVKDDMPPALEEAIADVAALRAQEDARLLYVAMTRAESWLIVAGAGEAKMPESWYNRVSAGLGHVGAVPCDMPTGQGLRYQHLEWPDSGGRAPSARAPLPATPAPLWETVAAPLGAETILSPSQLGGAKALPGEAGESPEAALARGTQLHLLLEHLPHWPADARGARARDLLASTEAGVPLDLDALMAEAEAVLAAPSLAPLFAPGTLAEAEITGTLFGRPFHGVIDRLVVSERDLLAVDYKSNRVIPARVEEVPEGLLRQMAAYRALLAQVYPGHEVRVALLWTARAELMELPAELLDAALERAALESGAGWA
ncbi:MAG: double-strand break repair helicase AddA [Rhodobacteraceae bacterium]|nr:MAG: double-strand break repair helicase AddA [Paracoccaceae bacterium]